MTDGRMASLFLAWVTAFVASLGALFAGEVLGQTPCVLCWYQRIAMFPLAIVLGIAYLRGDLKIGMYALPLALAGAAFAVWHVLLYLDVLPGAIEPCGIGPSCRSADMMFLDIVPLPVLSLGAFVAITALLLVAGRKTAS